MAKKWPIRWDLLLRYRLIEIVALWEGRLTTNHLCNSFGIGRQQASKDINNYLRDIAPNNLEYDRHLKGYKPSPAFKPAVTTGKADEYLHLLSRNQDISHTFEGLDLHVANTEILPVPSRAIHPEVLRPLVQAAREGKRVEVEYVSLRTPNPEIRVIAPHTLVFTGLRWHVRAYCEKRKDYIDFVLSRFRGTPDIMDESPNPSSADKSWHTPVKIRIKPDTRLSPEQRKIIAADYGMKRNTLVVETRAALVEYALQALNIDHKKIDAKPEAQQIIVENLGELEPFLF